MLKDQLEMLSLDELVEIEEFIKDLKEERRLQLLKKCKKLFAILGIPYSHVAREMGINNTTIYRALAWMSNTLSLKRVQEMYAILESRCNGDVLLDYDEIL